MLHHVFTQFSAYYTALSYSTAVPRDDSKSYNLILFTLGSTVYKVAQKYYSKLQNQFTFWQLDSIG